MERNHNMWQLESDATNASSGSTASSAESGGGTTCGDAEASSSIPPSKVQVCRRLNRLSVNDAPSRLHDMVAVYDLIRPQSRSSLGLLSPSASDFCKTVLCSYMFICAESPIFSAGQPSSTASFFRAARLLSRPSSFIRSMIETFQLSFCGLAAESASSMPMTSTMEIGWGEGGGGVYPGGGIGPTGMSRAGGGGGAACASGRLNPSFSKILPNRLMSASFRFGAGRRGRGSGTIPSSRRTDPSSMGG